MTTLTADAQHTEHIDALARVYQGADRILTGERLTCRTECAGSHMPAAWTDGAEITFNADVLGDVDFDDIVRYHGVNFHELSHVLYTPRKGTTLAKYVIARGYFRAFNLLEDQRIETLLTAKYRSTIPWLTAAILKWVLKSGCSDTGYLFVRGRRYLPGTLRGALRQTFARQDLLPIVDRIIDEYRMLTFPTDYARAERLIEDFHALMKEVNAGPVPDPHHNTGEDEDDMVDKGRPVPVKEQRDSRDRADDGEEETVPTLSDPEDDDDSESESGFGSGDADDTDQSDADDAFGDGDSDWDADSDDEGDFADDNGSQPGDGQSDPSQSDQSFDGDDSDHGDQSSEPTTGDPGGNGAGAGEGDHDRQPTLEDLVGDMLDEIMEAKDVRDEVRRTQRLVTGADASDIIPKGKFNPQPIEPDYVRHCNRLTKSLERLLVQAEPGWHKSEPTGRLNVRRWLRDSDPRTAFDRWDEGVHDAVDMEVVILLDESGSMGGSTFQHAVNSMWVLKRSFDKIGASTTVITFDFESRTLYHRNDSADATTLRYSFSGGGTDPVAGLEQAERIFARTRKTQKILIVLTDGEWAEPGYWGGGKTEDGRSSDDIIAGLTKSGVVTALGFIEDRPYWMNDEEWIAYQQERVVNAHNCTQSSAVTPDTLVPMVSNIVKAVIRQRLRGR